MVSNGRVLASPRDLLFRDPAAFVAGEIRRHSPVWQLVLQEHTKRSEILSYIDNGVDVYPFLRHFKGRFQGESFDSDLPPPRHFSNSRSCLGFETFITTTILDRVQNGSLTVVGKLGEVAPPRLVMPLTVEPSKPRLCHDERFLNLWVIDSPFSFDSLTDLPRYVGLNHYQTILDDKSGYDHFFLTECSRTFFAFQWQHWYFCYNTIPFGWKASANLYHTIGLAASSYIRSHGVPCSQYIEDCHIGQLRTPPPNPLVPVWSNFALAEAAAFIAGSVLIQLGYFIDINKCILIPQMVVPFLGYFSDSSRQAFILPCEKKAKFCALRESILAKKTVSLTQLPKFAGKTMSFTLVVPAAHLYSRATFRAISKAHATHRPVLITPDLLQELLHWRFLDTWTGFFPWRPEYHYRIRVFSDASNTGWGGILYFSSNIPTHVHGLWRNDERSAAIVTREALALVKTLHIAAQRFSNARIDCYVDSQVLVNCRSKGGSKSRELTEVLKQLFHQTLLSNFCLHLYYVPSSQNPADRASRQLSGLDCTLAPHVWRLIDDTFGPHSIDLMAIPANVRCDSSGRLLKFFSPFPLQAAAGTNVFSQVLPPSDNAYVFPPFVLIGPLIKFLSTHCHCAFSLVVPDLCPRRYWWPLLRHRSTASFVWASKDNLIFCSFQHRHLRDLHPALYNGTFGCFVFLISEFFRITCLSRHLSTMETRRTVSGLPLP